MPEGVDLTPLYRAAAKSQMIQGAVSIVIGAIMLAQQLFGYAGDVFIVFGVTRFLFGMIRWFKWCNKLKT